MDSKNEQKGVEVAQIDYFINGKPVPQGSMKTVWNPKLRRSVIIHQSSKELKAWRKKVREGALTQVMFNSAYGNHMERKEIGYSVICTFYLLRPISASKRAYHNVYPDVDKLTRAVLDGLTKYAYIDDSQVCSIISHKRYVNTIDEEGANIAIVQSSFPDKEKKVRTRDKGGEVGTDSKTTPRANSRSQNTDTSSA